MIKIDTGFWVIRFWFTEDLKVPRADIEFVTNNLRSFIETQVSFGKLTNSYDVEDCILQFLGPNLKLAALEILDALGNGIVSYFDWP